MRGAAHAHRGCWPTIRSVSSEVVEIPGAELAARWQKSCATQKFIVDESPSRQTKCAEHAFVSFRPGMPRQGLCERPDEAGCMASVSPCALFHAIAFLYLIYVVVALFKLGKDVGVVKTISAVSWIDR
jgi:hypothetical protein